MVQRNISRSEMLLKTPPTTTVVMLLLQPLLLLHLVILIYACWLLLCECVFYLVVCLDFGGFMFAVCISVGADLLIISNVHSLTQTFTFKTICGALVAVFKTTTRTVTGMEKCSFSEFGGTSYKKKRSPYLSLSTVFFFLFSLCKCYLFICSHFAFAFIPSVSFNINQNSFQRLHIK